MKHGHGGLHGHEGHSHGGHGHEHKSIATRRLGLSIGLTGTMMVVEVVGGLIANSLALISDAGHMLTHVIALAISYFAIRLAMRPVTEHRSYGWYRAEILAAFTNGIFLVGVTAYILYEAAKRLISPVTVNTGEMLVVAALGLVVNIISAFLLGGAGKHDLNVRSAFLHMIGDMFSSIAIVMGGMVILFTGWYVIDPALSAMICVPILYWAFRLLRQSMGILLEFAPHGVKVDEIADYLCAFEGVKEVHDLHVWQITSLMNALSAHVLVGEMTVPQTEEILRKATGELHEKYAIDHLAIQFETARCEAPGEHYEKETGGSSGGPNEEKREPDKEHGEAAN
jgi:cobalt-zinc-cadmium efflux system protein